MLQKNNNNSITDPICKLSNVTYEPFITKSIRLLHIRVSSEEQTNELVQHIFLLKMWINWQGHKKFGTGLSRILVCFEDFPSVEISSFKLKDVPGISRTYTNHVTCLHQCRIWESEHCGNSSQKLGLLLLLLFILLIKIQVQIKHMCIRQ